MLETIVLIVIVCCLLGTVIWAAQKFLTVPEPFAWVKGVLIFVLVVVACFLIFDMLVGHHYVGAHALRW